MRDKEGFIECKSQKILMVSTTDIAKEYDFVLQKFGNADIDPYMKYLLAFAFKGQRPFEINIDKQSKTFQSLSINNTRRSNFEHLVMLKGVGFSTASAILHFMFPDEYVIIDNNVLRAINGELYPKILFSDEEIKLFKIYSAEQKKLDNKIEVYNKYVNFLLNEINKKRFNNLREAEKYYFEKIRDVKE